MIIKHITKSTTLMVRVVGINGAVVLPVDNGDIMKVYNGFAQLLRELDKLPITGWVFVDRGVDIESEYSIEVARYLIAETELEQIDFEKTKRTFIECPTLVDVVSLLNKRPNHQGLNDYIAAVIFYRENDDFLD
ncbi:hypothetical protein AAH995_28000 [Pseudomonas putida]|uniref:hypothetical protein n=1 Tax=Pseudomonas TaxID=286 RepID=UPI001670CAE6|nr:hypothetical protein [Pseudomonas putida]